jgi:hypothetical protein
MDVVACLCSPSSGFCNGFEMKILGFVWDLEEEPSIKPSGAGGCVKWQTDTTTPAKHAFCNHLLKIWQKTHETDSKTERLQFILFTGLKRPCMMWDMGGWLLAVRADLMEVDKRGASKI